MPPKNRGRGAQGQPPTPGRRNDGDRRPRRNPPPNGPSGAGPTTAPTVTPSKPPLTTNRAGHASSPSSRGPRPVGQPPNSCADFWTKGTCDRGFDCRFKHIAPADPRNTLTPPVQVGEPVNQFMQDAALDKISTASDVFSLTKHTLTPTEAHNHIKPFLRDGYDFRTSQNMHAFATILSSANSESSAWKLSEGQSFLSLIAKAGGTGVLLMGKIFRHDRVSTTAGRDQNTLSFQRGYLPIFTYLSSDFVIKSTMHHEVNSLYSIIDINFGRIAEVLDQCTSEFLTARSFVDPGGPTLSGAQIFRSITTVLTEYTSRYKNAVLNHPTLHQSIQKLSIFFNTWATEVRNGSWEDSICDLEPRALDFLLKRLAQSVQSLLEIVGLAEGVTIRRQARTGGPVNLNVKDEGLLTALEMIYVGPGYERHQGPRNDNDHADISDIRIVPTSEELTCGDAPYLPSNVPGGRHHLPNDSMARLVDIQFRLLREELIAPIKSSITLVLEDLAKPTAKTQLSEIFKKKGGMYRATRQSPDAVMFNVYTNVEFAGMECDHRNGLSIELSLDSPNGAARHKESSKRQDYWKHAGKKRLNSGSLVAMIWQSEADSSDIKIYLGVISSNQEFLAKSARASQDRMGIKVSFFDQIVEFKILQLLQRKTAEAGDLRFLIEAPIMFEAIRPFLETLQQTNPSLIPFSKYLVHHPSGGSLKDVKSDPPIYATRPGFTVDLSSLFGQQRPGAILRPTDPDSIQAARKALKTRTTLDPSQADAIVDSLTREISLIQGPPGTGKSYTGVELIRVLLANNIKPIILIAFTNHALDHLLINVVEAGITKKIIRLGGQSKEERISAFSLGEILKLKSRDKSQANRSERHEYHMLKTAEESMKSLLEKILARDVKTLEMETYLSLHYPNHLDEVSYPPLWITEVFEKDKEWSGAAASFLEFWRRSKDLDFIDPPPVVVRTETKDKKGKGKGKQTPANKFGALLDEADGASASASSVDLNAPSRGSQPKSDPLNPEEFFRSLNLPGIPPAPSTDRPGSELRDEFRMWKMSRNERARLWDIWVDEVRTAEYEKQEMEFTNLRELHAEARVRHENAQNQTRLDVLRNADLIGCTTNGAAKLTALLKSLEPKVLLVEEAGQVLEAHIIASLVPSIQSMVLIGDPLQLRPTLANYHLSMDNKRTGQIYRFDQSLMERLSGAGFHMSQLEVQRRMQPEISNFIRKTLYPRLQDHDRVKKYPSVRGLAKNVFFLSHEHAEEGGGEDSVSKTNTYEAAMVKDLVMHLLRQGTYSSEGSIVVLCAYLGQLVKIQKELAAQVTTVIDERDEDQLINHEENPEVAGVLRKTVAEQLSVTKRVIIRTVDNFQGEEADIIILSLVRNSGNERSSKKGGIGFLKSPNRSNVALSRARHGLYILGNSADLASASEMWSKVVQEFRVNDNIGDGFPISCHQHPGRITIANEPGMIASFAPDGGCLVPCGAPLPCGHQCPWKCHSDDPEHISVKCMKDCQRLCKRYHPCRKRCADACGDCPFLVPYALPSCGHTNQVLCHQLDSPERIVCQHLVAKKLPGCEHTAVMGCGMDPSQYICKAKCDLRLLCCGKPCTGQCSSCQALSPRPTTGRVVPRQIHTRHPCVKPLYCQHLCNGDCSTEHDCSLTVCQDRCLQKCSHRVCGRACAEPCPPCVEPICDWRCDHVQCPVACGSVCARVPCDKRCTNTLKCGHRCPSVCGEDCNSQICPSCASLDVRSQVVDMIMGITMNEVDPHGEELEDILITLDCRHVFTVETLDGTCHLQDYYTQHNGVWTGLAQPPQGLQKPPVCPTCRGPISARRYGRVFKRAKLDMLEQHIANSARRAIRGAMDLRTTFDVDATSATLGVVIGRLSLPDISETVDPPAHSASARKRLLTVTNSLPLPPALMGTDVKKYFPLPKTITLCWGRVVRPLLRAYDEAFQVAKVRSSNYIAYEAAFATLYRLHLGNLPGDVAASEHSPENYAQEQARIGCGQAPPRADMRFRVEAIWASIDIRFDLVKLARAFLEHLKTKRGGDRKVPEAVLKTWAEFLTFIHESSSNDCNIAIRLATESSSHRQVVKSTLILLRITFESFSDRATQLLATSSGIIESRKMLATEALAHASETKRVAANTARTYRLAVSGAMAQQEWLQREFSSVVDVIVDQWAEQARKLKGDTFYAPVELGEMEQIVRAFSDGFHGFTTRGHWYTCPQGHVYVITECGGAMQRSVCPECGATIGGGDHQLDGTNQRATQMENLSRNIGLNASPFPWGAGV